MKLDLKCQNWLVRICNTFSWISRIQFHISSIPCHLIWKTMFIWVTFCSPLDILGHEKQTKLTVNVISISSKTSSLYSRIRSKLLCFAKYMKHCHLINWFYQRCQDTADDQDIKNTHWPKPGSNSFRSWRIGLTLRSFLNKAKGKGRCTTQLLLKAKPHKIPSSKYFSFSRLGWGAQTETQNVTFKSLYKLKPSLAKSVTTKKVFVLPVLGTRS